MASTKSGSMAAAPAPRTIPRKRPEIPRGLAPGVAGVSEEITKTIGGVYTEGKSDPKPTTPACGLKATYTTVTHPVHTSSDAPTTDATYTSEHAQPYTPHQTTPTDATATAWGWLGVAVTDPVP